MFTHRIFLTRSGEPLFDVDVSAGRWRRALGDGGGQHTIPDDWELADLIDSLTEPNMVTLGVIAPSGRCVYAGLILTDDHQGEATEIQHKEGPWELFTARGTHGIGGFPIGGLGIWNRGPEGALRAILARATGADGVTGGNWYLPIDLPPNTAGSISFTWKAEERLKISDCLKQLADRGYQIDLVPYIDGKGWLRYSARIAPRLTGGLFEWSVSTARRPVDTPVTSFRVRRDGRDQLTGLTMLGKGLGDDKKVGEAENEPGPDIPVRDAVEVSPDTNDPAALVDQSRSGLRKRRYPVKQFDFSLQWDENGYDIADFQPGARIDLDIAGHFRVPDGLSSQYLVAVAGGIDSTITPEVQPL